MKAKPIALLIALAALAALLAAACGGDGGGGGEASIRTQKGLSVAALAAGAQAGEEAGDLGGDAGLPTDAAAPDTAVGTGREGLMAPDFAPYSFPSLQESQTGITVQGYGSASADADSAVLELYFGGEFIDGIEPLPEPEPGDVEPEAGETEPGFEESSSEAGVSSDSVRLGDPGTRSFRAQEITEADLQPVVDAIAAQGVSAADIEVIVEPFYGDPYYGGSATVRVSLGNVDALEGIVDAATQAASGLENISFNGSSVSYTVSDCAALEQAAMEAAVEDARERGQSFASALGVGLGGVVGASHYSYSPFGAPCDSGLGDVYPLRGIAYAEGQSSDVQLVATVTITFAIQ